MNTLPFHSLLRISIILITTAVPALSQSPWSTNRTDREVSLTYVQPTLKETFGSFRGHAFHLTGRFPLSDERTIIADIPYSTGHYEYHYFFYPYVDMHVEQNDDAIGNLYIGIESKPENGRTRFNIGFFLPTMSDQKPMSSVIGVMGDPDQYESFIPNYLIISMRMNPTLTETPDGTLALIARVGMSGMLLVKKRSSFQDNFEAFVNYALHTRITSGYTDLLVGFSGKMLATESGDLSDRIMHQIGLSASHSFNGIRPGIFFRFPLNKAYSDIVTNSFGGSITAEL